jgi:hypothetical protein
MTRGLHWFRNDLRLHDNTALRALCDGVEQWLPVFVLDPRLLQGGASPRARFLVDCLRNLSDGQRQRQRCRVFHWVFHSHYTPVRPLRMMAISARMLPSARGRKYIVPRFLLRYACGTKDANPRQRGDLF